MQSSMVNIYKVGVRFNGTEKTFDFHGGDMLHDANGYHLTIPPGIHAIVFTLETTDSTDTASFLEQPVLWTVPDAILSSTSDAARCSLVVVNLNDHVQRYGFKLIVSFGDKVYWSHDPTIINDPPVSPPQG
jgi:hypothetical protein